MMKKLKKNITRRQKYRTYNFHSSKSI